MPPSWLRGLADRHATIPPELEHADWTRGLGIGSNATSAFAEGLLSASNISLQGEVCAFAVEPVLGYLAVGTSTGSIHLFGKPSVHISWTLRPANKLRHLLFRSGSPLLIAVDDKDNLSVFDLSRNDPQVKAKINGNTNPFMPAQSTTVGAGPSSPTHTDTPMRIGAYCARNSVTCLEVSPLHDHLFLGLRDGTVDAYDLGRLCASPYRVPNLWWEEEEILRKSGVPDAPNRRHVPLIIDIKTHPKDINQLLLAYEGGVILLDVRQTTILKTYQLRHLPGAVGSGVGNPDLMWTERASPATCVTWRPDGLVFACGHEDGCISFWDVQDDSKPVMVRTLELIDVDKPTGMPDDVPGGRSMSREPIFKLTWSGFPEQSWLDLAANATSKIQQQQYQQQHAAQQQLTSGSILTVLGGATERHPPGLVCLHLPPFAYPYSSYWSSKTPEALAKARQALHASLETTSETRYATHAAVEDFLLLPKSNPYYDLTFDPMALIILEAKDPLLPPMPPPSAARGLSAYTFPPPAIKGLSAKPGQQSVFPMQKLNMPLPLSTTGSGAILGAKLVEVPLHSYRKLAGKRDVAATHPGRSSSASEAAAEASAPVSFDEDLLLRGGTAVPTVVGASIGLDREEALGAMAKGEKLRILVTWHIDGTVRFHDASLQLLLLTADRGEGARSDTTHQRMSSLGLPLSPSSTSAHKYLEKAFPSPLPHLTIDVRAMVRNPAMVGHPIFERLNADLSRLQIVRVELAPEALETIIVLRSGQVLHYKYGFARYSETEEIKEAVAEEIQQEQELAVEASYHQLSPSVQVHRQAFTNLDDAMAGAMNDLNTTEDLGNSAIHGMTSPSSTSSPAGVPPPRPRRDPKRLSVAQRSGVHSGSDGPPFGGTSDLRMVSPRAPPLPMSPPRQSGPLLSPHGPSLSVDELTQIGHLASWDSDGFKPNILIELQRGEVTAIAISDVGFLAVACGMALAVVDLRGPELSIREGFGDGMHELTRAKSHERREEKKIVEEESKSGVCQLKFSICRNAEQPVLSPTLIAVRESGFVTLWTFTKSSLELWLCERSYGGPMEELRKALHIDVIDMAGNSCPAVPGELQRSLREQSRGSGDWERSGGAPPDVNILFGATSHLLSLRVGLCGPRLAKAEVEEDLQGACIVSRHGEKVCVALSATSIRLYSLPHLRLLTRVPRHNRNREERLSLSRVDVSFDSSGDFIERVNSLDIRFWTIFATMPRPGAPSLLLYQPPSMPMAPGMLNNVANSVVNWIGGKSSGLTTAAQFDEVVAGSKRPPLPNLPEPKYMAIRKEEQAEKERAIAAASAHDEYVPGQRATTSEGNSIFNRKKAERKQAVQDTQAAAGQASWNIDLAKQRGEMMNSLEEGLSSLEKGAKGWMQATREDMIKQAAKNKLSKLF